MPHPTARREFLGVWVCTLAIALSAAEGQESLKPFLDVTEATGLNGNNHGVAAWGDFNNDGWVDLCIGGEIWRNEAGKRFTSAGRVAGSGIWGDYDNDGYLDLFCCESGTLYHNEKGREFKQVPFPPRPMTVSLGACWGDFDRDGFLDLYVGGYENNDQYLVDAISRNRGDGSFEEAWRTKDRPQPARGITAADFNEDGHLDVFVCNYRLEANLLWLNDGKGNFTDQAKPFGAAGNMKLGAYGHTIGSAWGDLDNDGYLDLFVGNFSHPPDYQDRSQFLRNQGPKENFHFEDMTNTAKLRWQESYASPALGDFDNDGLLDLYFTTVYPGDSSVLYRNLGGWKFEEMKNGDGLSVPQTYQAAWADFDNDGHLDLMTSGRLFRNPGGLHHWLKVTLVENGKINAFAIGAQVRIRLGDHVLTRQVEGATGQGNQNDLTLHFGLGERSEAVELEIRWPDGRRQEARSDVDRCLRVQRQ